MRRFVFTFAAVMNLLLVDQALKAYALAHLKGVPAVNVIENLFNLAYVENRGCAWGFFQGQVWPLALFACVALVVVLVKRKSIFPPGKAGALAEIALYAGILGNLVDRLYLGYVVDFLDFYMVWGGRAHHFPCFNAADIYINVAAGLLILLSFFAPNGKRS